jgi:hypothetical protein
MQGINLSTYLTNNMLIYVCHDFQISQVDLIAKSNYTSGSHSQK